MESMLECLVSWYSKFLVVLKSVSWSFPLFSPVLLFTSLIPVALCCSVFSRKQEHFGKGTSKEFQLFSSPLEKDLLFKNSAIGLIRVPSRMDYKLYLGHNYVTAIRNVREGTCKYSGKARNVGNQASLRSSHNLSGDCQPLLGFLFLSCLWAQGWTNAGWHQPPRALKAVHILNDLGRYWYHFLCINQGIPMPFMKPIRPL